MRLGPPRTQAALRRRSLLGLGAAAAAVAAFPAAARLPARQVSFQRWQANTDMVFDYRIVDFAGADHRLGFRLPVNVIDRSRYLVSPFTNEGLADFVEAALRHHVARMAPGVAIDIVRQPRRLEFVVRGTSQSEVDRISAGLNREYARAEREYLQQGFLVVDERKVFIDYPRIVARYAPVLRPAGHAIANASRGRGVLGRLNLALALIQTIPYDELLSRDVESGVDFVTPPVLFDTNKGDCDSKAVALAAILSTLIEGSRTVIVLLPNHAVLGIDLPARGGERTLRHGGRQFLLMEPAGPAPFLPGQLFPTSAADLDAGRVERVAEL